VETEELIRSEIYHSFISEMSMYMYQKVDIYPKVPVLCITTFSSVLHSWIYSSSQASRITFLSTENSSFHF